MAKSATSRKRRIEALAKQLRSRSSDARADAALRLGELETAEVLPILETRLHDRSPEVRMRVVEALAHVPGSDLRHFVSALDDRDELVRVCAAEAIGNRGRSAAGRASTALRRALTDPSPLVRSYAASALGHVGAKSDLTRLRRYLEHESSDGGRLGIAEGMWALGDEHAFEDVLNLLNSQDYRVRSAAAKTLATTLLSTLNRPRIVAALRARKSVEKSRAVRLAISKILRTFGE